MLRDGRLRVWRADGGSLLAIVTVGGLRGARGFAV